MAASRGTLPSLFLVAPSSTVRFVKREKFPNWGFNPAKICVVSPERIVKILNNIFGIDAILPFDGEKGRVVVVDGPDNGS